MRILKKILLLALLFLSGKGAFSQPGTIDSSYATNGSVLTNHNPALYLPDTSTMQQDGKVILMGRYGISAGPEIGMSRYNIDGTIDTSFGTAGLVSVNLGAVAYGNSITLQADGKIVVAGYIENTSSTSKLLVLRFNINGSLDNSFGINGKAIFDNNMSGMSVKMQSDNKIVVGGRSGNAFAIARLNTSGDLDEDFGFNGFITTTITSSSFEAQINAINIQSDGKIVASGYAYLNFTNNCFCTVRYEMDGMIDTTFGTNGKVITDLNPSGVEIIKAQALQQDGKIVVTGLANSSTVVARYLANGTLDSSYGVNGVVVNTFGDVSVPFSLLIQPDNKVVIVGNSPQPTDRYFIARYTEAGFLDTTFNTNGYNMMSFGNNNNIFNSVLLQQDGKLLATGYTQIVNDVSSVIVRFNSGLLNISEFDSQKIKVYPNPTVGMIMFDNTIFGVERINVYNLTGQQVMKTIECSSGEVSIDLSNILSGTYIIQLESENEIFNARVIKL